MKEGKFLNTIGKSAKLLIIQLFIIGREYEYNVTDIATGTGLTRPTCHKNLKDLINRKVITNGKLRTGRKTYKFNMESKVGKKLLELFHTIIGS
jgi:DNA-binding MarR family transcriptional regulator